MGENGRRSLLMGGSARFKFWAVGLPIVLAIAVAATWMVTRYDMAFDWRCFYRPAASNWRDPYQAGGTFNAPWLYWLMHPLTLLRWPVDYAVLTICSLLALYFYVGSPPRFLILMATAPVMILVIEGQVDALLLLAFMLPSAIALPLAGIKPQGLGLAVLRRSTLLALVVALVVGGISLAVWGNWLSDVQKPPGARCWVFWPGTIPVGLILAGIGWRGRSNTLLCLATLLIVPYYSPSSIVPALASFMRERRGVVPMGMVVVLSWVWYIYFFL